MRQDYIDRAVLLFDEGYSCAQAVLLAFSPSFGLDESTAKLISSTFGGGMGRLRLTCGAVTGAFMVLGLAYGARFVRESACAEIGSGEDTRHDRLCGIAEKACKQIRSC
jgi:C_GCAxxG_C_C family probable redox protein